MPTGPSCDDGAMSDSTDMLGGEDDTPERPPGPGLGLDDPAQPLSSGGTAGEGYRVLALKYRPSDFSELIGQDALVRTLSNAIDTGRIAQAFMLTGVRGVGKTTTARIIAKALNCIGPDGKGGPTVHPCGLCKNCVAIAEDRHLDVVEMDAASRTGVNDIRELIEGVRYAPQEARYKVYVLDEVHMLSTNAFNALLKTLEEPPAHVKFVFATTEIRKVPVTVLSRCQRFDLRRVPISQLADHFRTVTAKEGVEIAEEAVSMIARAADGSVRDGLSILDQAIALSAGPVTAERVRDMLGLSDRTRLFDLFDAILKGNPLEALAILDDLYAVGADPIVVIEDLLEIAHFLTRAILAPEMLDRPTTAELERTRGREMSQQLTMPVLSRAWQMLLKGLGEVRDAPSPIQAAEMVIIRLIHVSTLLPPGDLVAKLTGADGGSRPDTSPSGTSPSGVSSSGVSSRGAVPAGGGERAAEPGPQGGAGGSAASGNGPSARLATVAGTPMPMPKTAVQVQPQTQPHAHQPTPAAHPMPNTLAAIITLFEEKKEPLLATHLKRDIHLVRLEPGRLEFRPARNAPRDLHGPVGKRLTEWTDMRWVVSISNEQGDPTLAEQMEVQAKDRMGRAEEDPLVKAIKATFPKARITKVTGREPEFDPADMDGTPDDVRLGTPRGIADGEDLIFDSDEPPDDDF